MGRVGSSIQHISAPVLTCANLSHVSPLNVCQVIRNAFMKVHKDNVPIKRIALLIILFLTAALQKEKKKVNYVIILTCAKYLCNLITKINNYGDSMVAQRGKMLPMHIKHKRNRIFFFLQKLNNNKNNDNNNNIEKN